MHPACFRRVVTAPARPAAGKRRPAALPVTAPDPKRKREADPYAHAQWKVLAHQRKGPPPAGETEAQRQMRWNWATSQTSPCSLHKPGCPPHCGQRTPRKTLPGGEVVLKPRESWMASGEDSMVFVCRACVDAHSGPVWLPYQSGDAAQILHAQREAHRMRERGYNSAPKMVSSGCA